MVKQIQAVRGMNDILPQETPFWQHVETALRHIIASYGYQEIRLPIVEDTALFKRSIGEVTDIVEKEMYTFDDDGDSLTLRPEGTAGCVRACLQHSLLYGNNPRLWYMGQMFRHERPQKGRYRQFYQLGVEAFGLAGPDIDAELIAMSARFWQALGLQDHVSLQLNTLGTVEERQAYRQALIDYFSAHQQQLDEDSQRRLTSNPLRILDSKNPEMQSLIAKAPTIEPFLQSESAHHFATLCEMLDSMGINYHINPHIVRGLDYYSHTVFEWVTDVLGAQGTVCAGGRFNGLVEQLGGQATPAVGFAAGIDRIVLLYQEVHQAAAKDSADIYLINVGEQAQRKTMLLAESIRQTLPELRIVLHCGGGSFKSQFKKADKSGAEIAIIVGEEEAKKNTLGVKFLRQDLPQEVIVEQDLLNFIRSYFQTME